MPASARLRISGIGQAKRLETELHVLQNGQPRKQREGLEHHRDTGRRPGDRMARYMTCPAIGSAKPAINRSKVDLPDPERPSSPTISPSASVKLDIVEDQQLAAIGAWECLAQRMKSSNGAVMLILVTA